jgi:hypothetical protein
MFVSDKRASLFFRRANEAKKKKFYNHLRQLVFLDGSGRIIRQVSDAFDEIRSVQTEVRPAEKSHDIRDFFIKLFTAASYKFSQ